MNEVKFKMGSYSDLLKLFKEGKDDSETIYFSNDESKDDKVTAKK